jgi:hypothetical protein
MRVLFSVCIRDALSPLAMSPMPNCMTVQPSEAQYQFPYLEKSRGIPASTLVTALIRYIYKGACKLLSGQASSLLGPEEQSARSSHDPRPQL